MPFFFACTLFLSALLLFLVQPMIAKMILPSLGGTPAVWNTCMVFFQAVLLAGYTYAHLVTTHLKMRSMLVLHFFVCLLPLAVLPISLHNWEPPLEANPIPWILAILGVSVGVPFFVLSTTAPLVQKWFAASGHRSARDPYFLYAASNFGSMLALLAYPTMVEPLFSLQTGLTSQVKLWTAGYGLLLVFLAICAAVVWHSPQALSKTHLSGTADKADPDAPSRMTRFRWVMFAFVPSSLMLGVTTHITLDIAAIPLLWVIPLALYLLSFILVFAYWPPIVHKIVMTLMPLSILLLIFIMESAQTLELKITTMIGFYLGTLFLVALGCHGELARTRPSSRHLTGFYLLMSLGGVLGGLFNSLVAPLIFTGIYEHLVTLALACLILPTDDWQSSGANGSVTFAEEETSTRPVAVARRTLLERLLGIGPTPVLRVMMDLVVAGLVLQFTWFLYRLLGPNYGRGYAMQWLRFWVDDSVIWLGRTLNQEPKGIWMLVKYGIPILLCYACVYRPLRFGLCVASLLVLFVHFNLTSEETTIHRERSFFGVLVVDATSDNGMQSHYLMHGTTLHGEQIFDPGFQEMPLSYFHPTGPIGQVMTAYQKAWQDKHLAVIGLGTGTLAAYAQKGQKFDYYEIDRAVVKIALDPQYFTFYDDAVARGAEMRVIMGDARLRLKDAPDHTYSLIVVDAFSSDAIPIHLLTREAIELYLKKLAQGGILAIHISNRHLKLSPVVGNLAQALRLQGLEQHDEHYEEYLAKTGSDWVVLARKPEDLELLKKLEASRKEIHSNWHDLETDPRVGVWTDDYSNILSIFSW